MQSAPMSTTLGDTGYHEAQENDSSKLSLRLLASKGKEGNVKEADLEVEQVARGRRRSRGDARGAADSGGGRAGGRGRARDDAAGGRRRRRRSLRRLLRMPRKLMAPPSLPQLSRPLQLRTSRLPPRLTTA